MVAQFSENLPCLRFTREGVAFDPGHRDRDLETFYEKVISQDVAHFAISEGYAPGLRAFLERLRKQDLSGVSFIKCHVTGPFTFAASVNDDKGIPLLHDDIMMQAVVKGLAMKALWQVEQFREFGKKIIVFIDEPYLTAFGSAFAPINKEDVISVMNEFAAALAAPDTIIGVHCCGNTDWSLFTQVQGISLINFDAFDFLERVALYASDLQSFLKRGGLLCWGIVPTQPEDRLDPGLLAERVRNGIAGMGSRGADHRLFAERLLVSPACGLGNRDPATASRVFELLRGVSGRLRSS